MKPDDFEQQLRNLPLRPVPPDWRAEMLIVARVAGKEARSMEREREVSVPWWRAWLWPCPQAWAGLAAVWVLLIGLHWGTPSPSAVAHKSGAGVTEELAGLAAQRRELTRLLDVPLDLAPAPESTVKPTPRSMAEPRSNPRAEVFSGRPGGRRFPFAPDAWRRRSSSVVAPEVCRVGDRRSGVSSLESSQPPAV